MVARSVDLKKVRKNIRNWQLYDEKYFHYAVDVFGASAADSDRTRAKGPGRKRNVGGYPSIYNKRLYYRLRYSTLSGLTYLPGRLGGRLTIGGYRFARNIYQFQ